MKKFSSVAGASLAALALGLGLVGCGSDSSNEAASSSETSAEATSSEAAESTDAAEPATPAGPNETIQDYIAQNDIQETGVTRGAPGSPTVTLPVPPGWQQRTDLPEAPFGAIFFPGSAVPANPPRVLALMSKLTGDVDPEKILEYAPGELQNMPGWVPMNAGVRGEQTGFDAVQVAGTYEIDGQKGLIAQKTIVIPADDGVFVLQLNGYSDEQETGVLGQATSAIDTQMNIEAP